MNPTIQPLQSSDLEQIPRFQPLGWNNVAALFRLHFGWEYFYPIKAVLNGEMVGIGELMLTPDTAWLGNIVVHPAFRGKGIGKLLTQHLMDEARKRGKKRQLLLATIEGAPLYEKLGFLFEDEYHFFKKEPEFKGLQDIPHNTHLYREAYFEAILELDARATGEDRSDILRRFLSTSHVYLHDNQVLEGFYMPALGDGLIVATTPTAGRSLLRLREMQGKFFITIPTQNEDALAFIQENGYTSYRKAILMRIGDMKTWQPEMIYSRVGGYLG